MAAPAAILHVAYRRALRRERVFIDRENPLEVYNDESLYVRYRFNRRNILFLLSLVKTKISHTTRRAMSLPALLQLTICLRFLGCGSFLIVVGDTLPRVSAATVCRCVRRFCRALQSLMTALVQMPDGQRLLAVKNGFAEIAGMPNVIGAIDCTHVPIITPSGPSEPDFVNRKGVHSINVQAICDHRYYITNAVIRWPGSVHDSRIFRESAIGMQFAQEPPNGFLLGDSGYACRNYLLTPFYQPRDEHAVRFNSAHCQTRVRIEQTFGILKNRFPCLKYLRVSPANAIKIISACFVLHDIACLRNDIRYDDADLDPDDDVHIPGEHENDGNALREHISRTYF